MAGDPVYRMQVEESTATWVSEHQGNTHYFCTPGCKDAFVENPEQYVSD
ncbi:MAG: YHS domain-containing protein [Gammaproteobacteria bacterium]|nr:YHS domain-containing protein [Gammaproteobacteria bacterium]